MSPRGAGRPASPRRGPSRAARGAAAEEKQGTFAAVYAFVRQVPRGRVVTYGQVARWIGLTRGARAVGWALRALDAAAARRVPWHRVIGQGGRISLGARPSGLEQRRRLRAEGVRFQDARVDVARHGWDPTSAPPRPRRRRKPAA